MGQYDGSIRINTKIDISTAKVNLKQLQSELAKTEKSVADYQRKVEASAKRLNGYYAERSKIGMNTDAAMLKAKTGEDVQRLQELEALQIAALDAKWQSQLQEHTALVGALEAAKRKQAELTQGVIAQKQEVAELVAMQEREKQSIKDAAHAQKEQLVSVKEAERAHRRFVQSSNRMGRGFLRMSLAMLGAEGAIGVLRKSINSFMAENETVANSVAAVWSALGNALGPIVSRIISLINTVMSAVASFIKALTGIDIIANYNAKALEKQAGATAGAGAAAEKAERQLAGFDEMNKLSDTSTGSGGGGGGGSAVSGLLTEIDNAFTRFAAKLGLTFKDIFFDWSELTPTQIRDKVFTGLGMLVGGIVGWKFTHTAGGAVLGATIGGTIALSLLSIDWATWKEKISTALWTFREWLREKVDKAFENLGNWINIDAGAFGNIGTWLSESLAIVLEYIDFAYWSERLGNFFGQLAENLVNGFDELFVSMKGHGGDIIEGMFLGILEAIANVVTWIWENIFQPFIEGFKTAFDINSPSGVMKTMGHYIMAGLFNGISEKIQTVVSLFTNLKARIQETFRNIGAWFGDVFGGAWETIKSKFAEWQSFWSNLWTIIKDKFSTLGSSIGSAISGAVKSAINGVISKIQSTINSAINIINGAIGVINAIPGVSVGYLSHVYLPRLAKGGIVNNPGMGVTAVIGEAGAEAVLPLERNTGWMDTLADKIASRIGGGEGQIVLNNYLNGRRISQELIEYQQRQAFAMNKA